jgi:hypothetical protein
MNLSLAAKEVSQAIQSLLHATQGLAPDQIKCDEALEALSEIMENLDGLDLTASVCHAPRMIGDDLIIVRLVGWYRMPPYRTILLVMILHTMLLNWDRQYHKWLLLR